MALSTSQRTLAYMAPLKVIEEQIWGEVVTGVSRQIKYAWIG